MSADIVEASGSRPLGDAALRRDPVATTGAAVDRGPRERLASVLESLPGVCGVGDGRWSAHRASNAAPLLIDVDADWLVFHRACPPVSDRILLGPRPTARGARGTRSRRARPERSRRGRKRPDPVSIARLAVHLLRVNARLPAGLGHTLCASTLRPSLEAVLPWRCLLGADPDRLARWCARLCRAASRERGSEQDFPEPPPAVAITAEEVVAEGIRAEGIRAEGIRAEGIRAEGIVDRVGESGWPVIAVEPLPRIELATSDGYHVATVQAVGDELRLRTEIARDQLPLGGPVATAAVGLFLLIGVAQVRLCRAVLSRRDRRPILELEAVVGVNADARELDLALGALSVACRHHAREAEALASDPELADAYLSLQLNAHADGVAKGPGDGHAPVSPESARAPGPATSGDQAGEAAAELPPPDSQAPFPADRADGGTP